MAHATDPQTSSTADATEQVARALHASWANAMLDLGWSAGSSFDASNKVHDALCQFESLSELDVARLREICREERLVDQLAGLVQFERGPARQWNASDLREGMTVVGTDGARGVVTGWDIDDDSVGLIRVRWADETMTAHHAASGELRRP